MNHQLTNLLQWLSLQRFHASVEKQTQADVEAALLAAGYSAVREKRLSDADIVDFMVTIGGLNVALEVKTKASPMAIYRQLERYAQHDTVQAIVLLTGTAMNLPETINGKPAAVASLGAGWL